MIPAIQLLAKHGSYSCAGNGEEKPKYHPRCYGIAKGDEYKERDPKPDKHGTRHCLKCHAMFFEGRRES